VSQKFRSIEWGKKGEGSSGGESKGSAPVGGSVSCRTLKGTVSRGFYRRQFKVGQRGARSGKYEKWEFTGGDRLWEPGRYERKEKLRLKVKGGGEQDQPSFMCDLTKY